MLPFDPMPGSAKSLTTYEYSGNNPVMMNDPMGNLPKPPPLTYNQGAQPTFHPTSDDFDGDDPTYDAFSYDAESAFSEIGGDEPEDYSDFWNTAITLGNAIVQALDPTDENGARFSGSFFGSLVNLINILGEGQAGFVEDNDGSITEQIYSFPNATLSVDGDLIGATSNPDNSITTLFKPYIKSSGPYKGDPSMSIFMGSNNISLSPEQWMQVISRNGGDEQLDQLPDASGPYYYSDYQLANHSGSYQGDLYNTYFSDQPGFAPAEVNASFSAQTSLLGFNRNGPYIIESVNYILTYQGPNNQVQLNTIELNASPWQSTLQYLAPYQNK